MKSRGVHLQYRFVPDRQAGADIENPLFDVLSALARAGSIQQAADTLGVSYRHLWGTLKQWEATLAEPLVTWVRGQPARLTPFAERLLWAERQARVRMAPHIEALRSELERVVADALDGRQQVLRIDASHDLALPLLQQQAASRARLHLDLRFAGSVDALRSLAEGRCIVAGFHVPPLPDRHDDYARALRPLLKPGRHKLIGCMRRIQGLMVAPRNPLAVVDLSDVVGRGLRFVDREPGAGTHLLTDHLLRQAGLDRTRLRVVTTENSHLSAAMAVASGLADVAVGVQAAAESLGLGFVPLVEEDYFLVCLSDSLDEPAVLALRDTLTDPVWARTLADLDGYAASPDAGQVLSLTRALPWWRFRTPRPATRRPDVTATTRIDLPPRPPATEPAEPADTPAPESAR